MKEINWYIYFSIEKTSSYSCTILLMRIIYWSKKMSGLINEEGNSQNVLSYYHNIIGCMPNLVYILDKDCVLKECNNNLLTCLGIEKLEDMKGSFYNQLVKHGEWTNERMQLLKKTDIEALLSNQLSQDAVEPPVLDKEGNITYFLSTRVPLLDKNQNTVGLVVILRNVSEQKQMEDQLEKIKLQLQKNNANTPASSSAPGNTPAITNPNVLLIEDNSIAQKAGQALLMQLDCKVEVADSGASLEKLFKPGKYNVVLMDIGLEDTSGYVLSKKIRQMERNTEHHVPIIALTSYEADVVKYDCVDYNMEGAITKPLTSEQAQQIIQHYVYHIDIPVSGLKSIKARSN